MAAPAKTKPIRSVAFVSLGCPKNLVDSERMLGLLAEDGLVITPDASDADAIVVNTCGFVEASKTESLQEIRDAVIDFRKSGKRAAAFLEYGGERESCGRDIHAAAAPRKTRIIAF